MWKPSTWKNTPEVLWASASSESINRLYITLPVDLASGEIENADEVEEFIRQSHEKSFEVWTVIGDRRDVMPENLDSLLIRVNAYRQFNTSRNPQNRIDGL